MPKTAPDLTKCSELVVPDCGVAVELQLIVALGEDPLVDESPPPRCGRFIDVSGFLGATEGSEESPGVLSADDKISSTGPFGHHGKISTLERKVEDGSGDRFTRLRLLAFLCSWSFGPKPPAGL